LRGKSWSVEEERLLRALVKDGNGTAEIAKVMGKTRVSVISKMYHLDLSVVDAAAHQEHTAASAASASSTPNDIVDPTPLESPTSLPPANNTPACGPVAEDSSRNNSDAFAAQLKKDEPLPTIEEKLKVLNAALVALETPGLGRNEIARLNKIIEGVKVYQNVYAGFVKYDAIEKEVLELKKQFDASRKNPP
jgi:hypothetical protein